MIRFENELYVNFHHFVPIYIYIYIYIYILPLYSSELLIIGYFIICFQVCNTIVICECLYCLHSISFISYSIVKKCHIRRTNYEGGCE